MAKKKMTKCIVVYDDEGGLCVPLGDDPDRPGALCCSNTVRMFDLPTDAKYAIAISQKYAELDRLLRGAPPGIVPTPGATRPENTDFLPPSRQFIKLMPVES